MDVVNPGAHTVSLCLNCVKQFTTNLPSSMPKSGSVIRAGENNDNDPVYLNSYKFNTRNPITGNYEFQTIHMTNIEVLTYVFELPPSDVTWLISRQVNSRLMCQKCIQILTNVFKARHEFQQLTRSSSCLYSIFNRSEDHHHQQQPPIQPVNLHRKHNIRSYIPATSQVRRTQIQEGPESASVKSEELETDPMDAEDLLSVYGDDDSLPAVECNLLEQESWSNSYQEQILPVESQTVTKLPTNSTAKTCDDLNTSSKLLGRPIKNSIHAADDPMSVAHALQSQMNREAQVQGIKKRKPYITPPKQEVTCPQCAKVFCTSYPRDVLRRHNETKHGQSPAYPCDICERPCLGVTDLRIHRLTHCSPEERIDSKYLCPECGKQLTTRYGLSMHISKAHRGDYKYNEFSCEKCGIKYREKHKYEKHIRRHEIEEGDTYYFFCKVCPAKFKFLEEFRLHPPSCPGEVHLRPHACPEPECSRRFKLKQALELHLNEVHKYTTIAAREFVYPGLGPRKFPATKTERKKFRESKLNSRLPT